MDLLANMPTGVSAVFWGVITFSVLVVIHEGGHFLAARLFRVKVHEFMIGLPGPAIRLRSRKSGVSYGVTAFPLGGYVRIAGMEPGPEDEVLPSAIGALADARMLNAPEMGARIGVTRDRGSALLTTLEDYGAAERAADGISSVALVSRQEGESDDALLARVRASVYRGQKAWKRITILAMGVLFNLLAAMLIFTVTLSVWGYDAPSLKIANIVKGSAAQTAGLRLDDTVLSVAGKRVTAWDQLVSIVSKEKPGASIVVSVKRAGGTVDVPVVLGSRSGHGFLGIGPGVERKRFTVLQAAGESIVWTGLVFQSVLRFFDPKTFATSVQGARSVVGISYEVAAAVKAGPINYAWMVALLSLSLGVMNILPIPPLDGGKVALEIVEAIRRKPLRREIAYGFSAVGAVLLFSLIFYLMYADVVRYIVKG